MLIKVPQNQTREDSALMTHPKRNLNDEKGLVFQRKGK
jgi:hypothetical protein